MAQAARNRYSDRQVAYAHFASSSQPRTQRSNRPNIKVIPGKGRDSRRLRGLDPQYINGFKIGLALFVVLAAICVVRVSLSVATVQVMQSAASLESSIDEARSAGKDLEIRHSALASPARVQKEAERLGMSSTKNTERITVSLPAKVVYNASGNISLVGTIASIENYAAGASK